MRCRSYGALESLLGRKMHIWVICKNKSAFNRKNFDQIPSANSLMWLDVSPELSSVIYI